MDRKEFVTGLHGRASGWRWGLAIAALAAVVLGGPALANAGPRSSLSTAVESQIQRVAGSQCVVAVNRVEGDVLVNQCNECRIANIEHHRRGQGFPVTRSYRIPEKGKMELSFKGSGKTRVVSDGPCDPVKPEAAEDVKNCAKLTRRDNGEPALVNACPVCRGVVIERQGSNGSRERETFALSPRTLLPIAQRGARRIKIVSELSCP